MANTFKVVNFAAEPASAGTPYVMYTAASGVTAIVLGLILSNIHTSQVTATVRLVSDTSNRAVTNNTANGTSLVVKDAAIPVGSSLELMSGNENDLHLLCGELQKFMTLLPSDISKAERGYRLGRVAP